MKNFTLQQKVKLNTCGCDAYEYKHVSGATLIYMDADTEEKAFCAAFKTVPDDSTGVFHILEHSVLDGSKNYPMGSPFLYMLKNSMNTFLNAMTFQGKTMYPCASCNPDDFENLMNVYLDSVFNPLLDEDTFMREGWHIEKTNTGYDIKGVVYNEMQGATASIQRQLYSAMLSDLYPDTYQSFNSGGEPSDIPSLTYEGYLAAYRKYYSAKNCVLFLRGRMDLERYTDIIDRYLADASWEEADIKYSYQGAHSTVREREYGISPTDDTKARTNIIFSYNIGGYADVERQTAAQLLSSYLMDNNSSPLKQALISSGLMQDADLYLSEGVQNAFGIAAYNTEKEHREAIEKIIRDTVGEIIEKGIDKEIMLSNISALSFKIKESRNAVIGLAVEDFEVMANNKFYGLPLDTYFDRDPLFEKFENEVESGYFEDLLKEIFLENPINATSVLVPVRKEPSENHQNTVKKYLSELSDEAKDAAFERFVELSGAAAAKDSPENIAKMPSLSLDKLQTKLTPKAFSAKGKILHTSVETNGVVYYNFYFSLKGLSADECMTAKLISTCLSDFATEDSTAEELSNRLNRYAGKRSFSLNAISLTTNDAQPYFTVSVACLEKNVGEALAVIEEVLTKTVYDEKTANTVMNRELNSTKITFINNGVGIALSRSASLASVGGVYNDLFGGYEYFKRLQAYAENVGEFCNNSKVLSKKLFTENNLKYVGVTGNEKYANCSLKLSCGEELGGEILGITDKRVVAYSIPSGVSFNVRSVDYSDVLAFGGKHMVLQNLLTFGYLWHNIREVGGAYGTGLRFSRSGLMSIYSYRDPKVKETYDLYNNIAEYLKTNEFSEKELLGCIISTLAEFTNPKSVEREGNENEIYYLTGYTFEKQEQHLKDVLTFTQKDIEAFIPVFEKFKDSRAECSVGNGNAQEASGLFEEILNV